MHDQPRDQPTRDAHGAHFGHKRRPRGMCIHSPPKTTKTTTITTERTHADEQRGGLVISFKLHRTHMRRTCPCALVRTKIHVFQLSGHVHGHSHMRGFMRG